MRIHFTRHGQSEANVARVVSNRGLVHPLTSQGRSDARRLAASLAGEGIVRVYSSPLLRAIETALVVAHALDAPLEVVDGLREVDLGALEGRGGDATWAAWRAHLATWIGPGVEPTHPPGGESFDAVRERFERVLATIDERHRSANEPVACVAHGALYRAMLPLKVRGVDASRFAAEGGFGHGTRVVARWTPQGLTLDAWYRDGVVG